MFSTEFINKMEKLLNEAWNYIENRLYYPKTGMLYDIILHPDTRIPTLEEIASSVPNPDGCGTMTEDGMISGGGALAGLCFRIRRCGEGKDFAERIADGMLCCAESGKDGFLPRSIQPVDGKSHYKDCSRDQLTVFLYGLLTYSQSGYCSDSIRKRAQKAVLRIANRAKRNVIPETGYNFLCEDGTPSQNSVYWGEALHAHEIGRLPFIYLVTWILTGQEEWLEDYRMLREEAVARSLPLGEHPCFYTLQQMAVTLDTAYRYDPDSDFREKYAGLLMKLAAYAEGETRRVREVIDRLERKYFVTRSDWYPFYCVQNAAILVILEAMAPGFGVREEAKELMLRTFEKLNLPTHQSALPVHFASAMEWCVI